MKLKDWLVKNGVQEERAETVTKIYRSLAVLTYREEVIASLTKILEKNNKKVRDEYVAALADVMMSRKKWSAMRLRDLYEGPGLYTALAALHGIHRGCGTPDDTLTSTFANMAEVGHERRQARFAGVRGEILQRANMEWWREHGHG